MKTRGIVFALAMSSVLMSACTTTPERPLSRMSKQEVESKVLGKTFEACHRVGMTGASSQDFSVPGKYSLTIHRGPRAGSYGGDFELDEKGGIRITSFNGPDGGEMYWTLYTDGKNMYVDRMPPHPRYPHQNYLWLNCS